MILVTIYLHSCCVIFTCCMLIALYKHTHRILVLTSVVRLTDTDPSPDGLDWTVSHIYSQIPDGQRLHIPVAPEAPARHLALLSTLSHGLAFQEVEVYGTGG